MPPSSVMRISPRRELRADNHKRMHSREKEDDLALFNEVQKREGENFLLQSNDDIDDLFSTKLKDFSNHKLGISVPTRGESSDLLNAEGDKNDYDWLITPPETPLFRSLDDEGPPVNLAHRGRARSQPVPISRSPSLEKGYRSSRGSPSPHRLSPSPRSVSSTLPSRSKPFSVTHSSPPPSTRHISPSRGLSPPPRKSTPPPSRSITPTPRRTSRGSSASPKIKAWQANNIPGFSSEAPPNLRTSLSDRPASYVRGSSPVSRNDGSRYGRRSMSPVASRSISSSHSKGSVVSSGDDDVDSLQSIPVSSLGRPAPRGVGVYPSNGAVSFSRKPTKSSSAPKRSFDLVRQMDRKGPQNMFRPLLSSVPSSTFSSGNPSSRHYSLTSRNSSITTSSNASSDRATSGPHDTEGIEQNQEDTTSGSVKGQYPYMDDEIFVMDQPEDFNEDIENKNAGGPLGIQHGEIDGPQDMVICSKCGLIFHSAEVVTEGEVQICLDCKSLEENSTITTPQKIATDGENNTGDHIHNHIHILEHGPLETFDQSASITEFLQVTRAGVAEKHHFDKIANESQHSYSDSSQNLSIPLTEENELTFAAQQVINHAGIDSNPQVDASKGAGISLLLNKSTNAKGYILQSRSFTASNTSFDDFSYLRDSVNSLKSSISVSVSSSVDLGSSRQTDGRIYRQKSDSENYRYEMPVMHKRSVSSMSGASGHNLQVPSVATSCHDYSFEEFEEKTCEDPREQLVASEFAESESKCMDIENSRENDENLTNKSPNPMNEESSSAQSEILVQEEDGPPSSYADRVDVVEVPNLSSLDAICKMEIENNADVVSADSPSDVDSIDSKSCTNELQRDEAITATAEEFDSSQSADHVTEESRTLSNDVIETKNRRSLTLEEATDTILFCSSIVHNLAYEAANIAIDKETLQMEALRPAMTGKLDSERSDNRHSRTVRKRISKSQKTRQKKLETDTKTPLPCNAPETDENSSPRFSGAHNNVDAMKPPKLESKCNCIIM